MSPTNEERRFSEDEFELVLRMASEVEEGLDSPPARLPSPEGMTLAEIQEIAVEVGIDPARVSMAVALLPTTDDSTLVRLAGGHPRQRLEHRVSGEVPAKDLGRLVEVARKTFGVQGETREVLGAVEWKGNNNVTGFSVSATPGEGKTTLHVSTDRTEALMGIYAGAGLGVLGAVALTMAKLVFGETDAGIVAALLSGIPPAFLVSRTLWKRSTAKWRDRALRLMDALAAEAEASVENPDVPPGGLQPGEISEE